MRSTRVLQIMAITCLLVNSTIAGWVTSGNDMYPDVFSNVGIGTSQPWSKLEVIGVFRLTEAVVFGNSSGAGTWWMRNAGPGKGPAWFPSFGGQNYDAKISLWDYTSPSPNRRSLFVVAGEPSDVDMIIDGRLGVCGDLTVGSQGDWRMGDTGRRKGPEWFGYFSNQDYDASMQIIDFANPALTKRSYLAIGGIQTDTDLIVDGRLGLLGNLVVGTSGKSLFADVSTGNIGIGTTSPSARLTVRGNILLQSESSGATVLELGEGLDYAEGFDVTDAEEAGPGTVLVIDPQNPGKLTVSTAAYDTKVAGIVAGAKGLGSGVRLATGQFDQNVALAGRVYCNVDAGEIAVQPGDLLTTSATLGHAMKATDHLRSQGAILGKAMESLEQGKKGQILVLVTLQ